MKSEKIIEVKRNKFFAREVTEMPDGMVGVYQLGKLFQLTENKAGVVLNIRCSGKKAIDLEVGNDIAIFDDVNDPSSAEMIILERSKFDINPITGKEILVSRYPKAMNFIPVGAKLADGTPHPAAGTGFMSGQLMGFPPDCLNKSNPFAGIKEEDIFYAIEFIQCSYRNNKFSVDKRELKTIDKILPGYFLGGGHMGGFVTDGADMLVPFSGSKVNPDGKMYGCGFARFKYINNEWHAVEYTPVAEDLTQFHGISDFFGNYVEPSMVRAKDGSLVFTCREVGDKPFAPGPQDAERLKVWRSENNGKTWKQIIEIPHFHPLVPLSINRCGNGELYITTNGYCTENSKGEKVGSIVLRETVYIWPLKEDFSGLYDQISVRDGNRDFGTPTWGSYWRLDHPQGETVRLKDGKLHSILAYRVLEHDECDSDAKLTPYTGCYLDEIITVGEDLPVWNF